MQLSHHAVPWEKMTCLRWLIRTALCRAQSRATLKVFLYITKPIFYFSSDRPAGVLPFENQHVGAEIYLPRHCNGKALLVLHLNNDGNEELIVGCFESGTFPVYTRGSGKDDWTLDNECNAGSAFGDLNNVSLAGISESDYKQACMVCKISLLDLQCKYHRYRVPSQRNTLAIRWAQFS